MKQILFLTDFSKASENAFTYALAMAQTIGAYLHILHIVPVIPPEDEYEEQTVHPAAKFVNDKVESMEWGKFREESRILEKIALDNDFGNVAVEFHFREGYFTNVATDFIEEKDISLVVLGADTRFTLDRSIFKTHTEKLLSVLDIPLLAVPSKAKYRAVKKFALGVMMKPREINEVAEIARRLSTFGNQLICVHIATDNEKYKESIKERASWLNNLADYNVSLEIRQNASTIVGLDEYVSENNVDILCTMHRNLPFYQRLLTKAISTGVLNREKTAVLIYNFNK